MPFIDDAVSEATLGEQFEAIPGQARSRDPVAQRRLDRTVLDIETGICESMKDAALHRIITPGRLRTTIEASSGGRTGNSIPAWTSALEAGAPARNRSAKEDTRWLSTPAGRLRK